MICSLINSIIPILKEHILQSNLGTSKIVLGQIIEPLSKSETIPYISIYPEVFKIDLISKDQKRERKNSPQIETLREYNQNMFIDIYCKDIYFLEKLTSIVSAVIILNFQDIIKKIEIESISHKTEKIIVKNYFDSIELIKGGFGRSQELYTARLEFEVKGKVNFSINIKESCHKIEQIDLSI